MRKAFTFGDLRGCLVRRNGYPKTVYGFKPSDSPIRIWWPERGVVATTLRLRVRSYASVHNYGYAASPAREIVRFYESSSSRRRLCSANSTTACRSHFTWYYFTQLCIVLGRRYTL